MGTFKFDEIAFNSTEKKKPVDEDKYTYLGLEHLDPDSIYVTRYGADVAPKGDKLVMKKGDVLFGKRRAYQKKVAIAPFDGIFSAHGMVLRPKEDVIDKNFFPMFIKSDYFLDAAIKISVGSLSPTINWRDLKELKFELPSLEEQRKLADVLWAIYDMKDKYKKLISATDELVKSQFIEMFGDQKTNSLGLKSQTLGDICEFYSGTGFPNVYQGNMEGTYPFYKVRDISRNVQAGHTCLADCENYINDDVLKLIKGSIIPEGTVVFAKIGEALRLNRRAITVCDCLIDNNAMGIRPGAKLTLEYFFQYMKLLDMGEYAGATAMPSVKKGTLETVQILVPDMCEQEQFSEMLRQSDKSKFALQEAIKDLDALSKKIIAENLIPAGEE
ncbi:MAG: restriction endonuclease subunit S [[Clostridium] innocuum]